MVGRFPERATEAAEGEGKDRRSTFDQLDFRAHPMPPVAQPRWQQEGGEPHDLNCDGVDHANFPASPLAAGTGSACARASCSPAAVSR